MIKDSGARREFENGIFICRGREASKGADSMIDNLDLYEMHEREQARWDRIYRKLKIEEEMENERITDSCKSATGDDNNQL